MTAHDNQPKRTIFYRLFDMSDVPKEVRWLAWLGPGLFFFLSGAMALLWLFVLGKGVLNGTLYEHMQARGIGNYVGELGMTVLMPFGFGVLILHATREHWRRKDKKLTVLLQQAASNGWARQELDVGWRKKLDDLARGYTAGQTPRVFHSLVIPVGSGQVIGCDMSFARMGAGKMTREDWTVVGLRGVPGSDKPLSLGKERAVKEWFIAHFDIDPSDLFQGLKPLDPMYEITTTWHIDHDSVILRANTELTGPSMCAAIADMVVLAGAIERAPRL